MELDAVFDTTDCHTLGWTIAHRLKARADGVIKKNWPDLYDMFATSGGYTIQVGVDEHRLLAFKIRFFLHNSIGSLEILDTNIMSELHREYEHAPTGEQQYYMRKLARAAWREDVFGYVATVKDDRYCMDFLGSEFDEWLYEVVAPQVIELNRARVLRTIPALPTYDLMRLEKALYVLECDQDIMQGTAFALRDIGLVTCNHALGSDSHVFKYDDLFTKCPVHVLEKHPVVDLAILQATLPIHTYLEKGDPTTLRYGDHLMVMGHANYRPGDTPQFIPGLVVGFRTVSGIRRILTNGSIVQGMSGGPVVDRTEKVIGVAVTGSESFQTASGTEDMAIIPIDALDLLKT